MIGAAIFQTTKQRTGAERSIIKRKPTIPDRNQRDPRQQIEATDGCSIWQSDSVRFKKRAIRDQGAFGSLVLSAWL